MKKWILIILLFSVAVNIAVVGTLFYFWKKPTIRSTDMMWIADKKAGMNNNIIVFKSGDALPDTANLDIITEKRMVWADTLQCICQDIEADRQEIIRLMLLKPPKRDSINIYIHRIGDKQVQAESLTVDHLLGIRNLLPERNWEELVKSLGSQRRIMVRKEITTDKQGKTALIEIKDIEKDIFIDEGK